MSEFYQKYIDVLKKLPVDEMRLTDGALYHWVSLPEFREVFDKAVALGYVIDAEVLAGLMKLTIDMVMPKVLSGNGAGYRIANMRQNRNRVLKYLEKVKSA